MISQNQTDRAIEQYEKIVKRKPSAAIYTLIGMLQDAKNNFDEAEKNYRKALEITPDISIAANNLAWDIADRESGNLDEAMQFAQSAADREPRVASYLDTLGWVYYKKGLYAPAIEHFRKAVALDERESNRLGKVSNPAYRLRLALVLASSGDRPNARKEVEVALQNEQGLSPAEARDAKNLLGSL
jgi:tetratricopeptide (TPR) repeat protein